MLNTERTRHILEQAELIVSKTQISEALTRLSAEITQALSDKYPLVLSV